EARRPARAPRRSRRSRRRRCTTGGGSTIGPVFRSTPSHLQYAPPPVMPATVAQSRASVFRVARQTGASGQGEGEPGSSAAEPSTLKILLDNLGRDVIQVAGAPAGLDGLV